MADYYEPGHQYNERSRDSQEQQRREPHPLNLKVLRASRPSLSRSKDLFRDDTSVGEPSASTSGFTLTPLLALPTSFGNINLGETFQGLIVAANDSNQDVYDIALRIEIQSASTRTILWETPVPRDESPRVLKSGDNVEAPLLQYEIREPGLHALNCSAAYRVAPANGAEKSASQDERPSRSFRKVYKFQATNPLAVKTKVHTSHNVTASLDEELEHTVFLEVQIQNTSPEPLLFEDLRFEPARTQQLEEALCSPEGPLAPQDIYQCLYIVKTKPEARQEVLEQAKHVKGAVTLGKLDIRWRGRMGEAGHLATSQLMRQLPHHVLPPAITPRPSMQNLRSGFNSYQTPDRLGLRSREASPSTSPQLPSDAFSPGVSPRTSPRPSLQADEHRQSSSANLKASLYVLPLEKATTRVGKVLLIRFKLVLHSHLGFVHGLDASKVQRKLRLAVQHVNYHVGSLPAEHFDVPLQYAEHPQATPTISARPSVDTPRPRGSTSQRVEADIPRSRTISAPLPPPSPLAPSHPFALLDIEGQQVLPSPSCTYLGQSLQELDEITINHFSTPASSAPEDHDAASSSGETPDLRISLESSTSTDNMPLEQVLRAKEAKRSQRQEIEFSLRYLARKTGLHRLGGVRVLLLEDEWMQAGDEGARVAGDMPRCTLVEHTVVAEVLVAV